MCYLNNYPRSTSEIKCRYELDEFLRQLETSTDQVKYPDVVFSHAPLDYLSQTPSVSSSSLKSRILSTLGGTQFILSGHTHRTKYTSHRAKSVHFPPLNDVHSVNHDLLQDKLVKASHNVYEITVPTCSYRMGERHMGVGATVLSELIP